MAYQPEPVNPFAPLKKYAQFHGRARRSEFWLWYLVSTVISWIHFVGWIWSLIVIIPTLAVFCRRMHDTGRSGKFVLLLAPYLFLSTIGDWLPHSLFPPVVNIIFSVIALLTGAVFIFFACQKSQPGENQYDLPVEEDEEELEEDVEESEEEPEEE